MGLFGDIFFIFTGNLFFDLLSLTIQSVFFLDAPAPQFFFIFY